MPRFASPFRALDAPAPATPAAIPGTTSWSSPLAPSSAAAIAALEGLQRVYASLRDTGHIGIAAADVAARRAAVEALISLPEYQAVEAATTERDYQGRVAAH